MRATASRAITISMPAAKMPSDGGRILSKYGTWNAASRDEK